MVGIMQVLSCFEDIHSVIVLNNRSKCMGVRGLTVSLYAEPISGSFRG